MLSCPPDAIDVPPAGTVIVIVAPEGLVVNTEGSVSTGDVVGVADAPFGCIVIVWLRVIVKITMELEDFDGVGITVEDVAAVALEWTAADASVTVLFGTNGGGFVEGISGKVVWELAALDNGIGVGDKGLEVNENELLLFPAWAVSEQSVIVLARFGGFEDAVIFKPFVAIAELKILGPAPEEIPFGIWVDTVRVSVGDWLCDCPFLSAVDAVTTETAGSTGLLCDTGTMLSCGSSVEEGSSEDVAEVWFDNRGNLRHVSKMYLSNDFLSRSQSEGWSMTKWSSYD